MGSVLEREEGWSGGRGSVARGWRERGIQRAHPFVWTKTADEIVKKANRPSTSNAGR